MPRKDGSGPMGAGAITGRGLGICAGVNAVGSNVGSRNGLGCRRGFGSTVRRGFTVNQNSSIIIKELLIEKKKFLENRLEFINKKLESL